MLSLQSGVSVIPKHFFGVNSKLKQSLFIQNDFQLIYVAGHNVIVYKTDEQTQYFLPGKLPKTQVKCIRLWKGRGDYTHQRFKRWKVLVDVWKKLIGR
jgi:hypothetical protein